VTLTITEVLILVPKCEFYPAFFNAHCNYASVSGLISLVISDMSKSSLNQSRREIPAQLLDWIRESTYRQLKSPKGYSEEIIDSLTRLCTALNRPDLTAMVMETLLSAPKISDDSLDSILRQLISTVSVENNEHIWDS
jgi:hypothetical protein